MLTRIKVYLSRSLLIKAMENPSRSCVCRECFGEMLSKNKLPCVCPRMDIPCAALKGKYTSPNALSMLIGERKAEIDGKYMVIEYDERLVNDQFVKAAMLNQEKDRKEDTNAKG